MQLPEIGKTYEKWGERREVIEIDTRNKPAFPDVIYRVQGENRIKALWLPFWTQVMQDADIVA
ncbi:MAG: hypothetical protein AB1634_04405 [Thermodesulfobacteriota bacterium]